MAGTGNRSVRQPSQPGRASGSRSWLWCHLGRLTGQLLSPCCGEYHKAQIQPKDGLAAGDKKFVTVTQFSRGIQCDAQLIQFHALFFVKIGQVRGKRRVLSHADSERRVITQQCRRAMR